MHVMTSTPTFTPPLDGAPPSSPLDTIGRAAADAALAGARLVDRFGPPAAAGVVLDVLWDGSWPPPLWVRPVRAVASASAKGAVRSVIRAVQLVSRGWAEQDTWNLELVLCERLSAQLWQLADTGHTYPGRGDYTDPEVWNADLRANAAALARFASTLREDDEVGVALDEAMDRVPFDQDVVTAAMKEQARVFEERLAAAQDALRWVADHLVHLND